ncbi:hypothetical protein [Lentisalinibacter salinarum]|uniref:hypothetical protein n=1 Tax=Lentisalinibacter salinarum TaxID=2992239 RepID=UPI00386CC639
MLLALGYFHEPQFLMPIFDQEKEKKIVQRLRAMHIVLTTMESEAEGDAHGPGSEWQDLSGALT